MAQRILQTTKIGNILAKKLKISTPNVKSKFSVVYSSMYVLKRY